jgi:hypothetical protein
MKWEVPYVIFRHKGQGAFEEVFQTSDFKKAKYWLTYIAEIGDVLCRTSLHNRHSHKNEVPEYFSHKKKSGTVSSDEKDFLQSVLSGSSCSFPDSTEKVPADYS